MLPSWDASRMEIWEGDAKRRLLDLLGRGRASFAVPLE